MPKVDRAEYEAGVRAFDAGGKLIDLIDRLAAADAHGAPADAEDKAFSFAIGFVDGALDAIRRAAA